MILTNYHVDRIRYYSKFAAAGFIACIVLATAIRPFFKDEVTVRESQYTLKDGFPLFTGGKEYISLLKKYPYNPTPSRIRCMRER